MFMLFNTNLHATWKSSGRLITWVAKLEIQHSASVPMNKLFSGIHEEAVCSESPLTALTG